MWNTSAESEMEPNSRGAELERQFPLGPLLEPAGQQADQLGLEDALQQTVVLLLVEDQEVILHCAIGQRKGRVIMSAVLLIISAELCSVVLIAADAQAEQEA